MESVLQSRAEKYVKDHSNEVYKVEKPPSKLLTASFNNLKEKEVFQKYTSELESVLRHDRVERRGSRNHAIWLKDQKLAKITKIVGSVLANFGFQNKEGKFLFPEEALFLLETNKLELLHSNKVPISVKQGYEELLTTPDCDYKQYMIYRKLVIQGFKVRRYKFIKNRLENKTETDEEPVEKRIKLETIPSTSSSNNELDQFDDIFKKLRENGPKEHQNPEIEQKEPVYSVFLTNDSKKNTQIDVFISDDLDNLSFSDNSVHAMCPGGNSSAFYTFLNHSVPIL